MKTLPAVGLYSLGINFNKVLFPQPLCPTNQVKDPAGILREAELKIGCEEAEY